MFIKILNKYWKIKELEKENKNLKIYFNPREILNIFSHSLYSNRVKISQLEDEIVCITGGSGGVGSAAIQLAKLRGAKVIAQCSKNKHGDVLKIVDDQELGDVMINQLTKLFSDKNRKVMH